MSDLSGVSRLGGPLALSASADPASRAEIIWLITVIILLFLGLVAAILFLRQRGKGKKIADTPKAMYSLHELRQLQRKGELTEEEFEKLKDVVNIQTRKQGPYGPPKAGP